MKNKLKYIVVLSKIFLFVIMIFHLQDKTIEEVKNRYSYRGSETQRKLRVIMNPEEYKEIERVDPYILDREELIEIQNTGQMTAFVHDVKNYYIYTLKPSILSIDPHLDEYRVGRSATIKDMEKATKKFLLKEYPDVLINSDAFRQLIQNIFTGDRFRVDARSHESPELAMAFFYMNFKRTDFFNNADFPPSTTIKQLIYEKVMYDFRNEEISRLIRKYKK